MVKRSRLFFLIMWLNFIAFFIEIFTGFVLWLAVPFGPAPKSFGFSQQIWLSIHKWDAIPVMAIILVHIFLHRKWMVNQFKSLFKGATKNLKNGLSD